MADKPIGKMADKPIGKITHYYNHINVGVLEPNATVCVGDRIRIAGKGIDFEQTVKSMQLEHKSIDKALAGQAVGLKLEQPAKDGCEVFRAIAGSAAGKALQELKSKAPAKDKAAQAKGKAKSAKARAPAKAKKKAAKKAAPKAKKKKR